MNISQLAKHLHVSKPTLYKYVKDAGIVLDDLRNVQTGELTQHGIEVISALFDNRGSRKDEPSVAIDSDALVLHAQVDALRNENELLRTMLEAKDAEIKRLMVDLEAWRQKAQEIDVQQLLLAATATPRRRGFFAALKSAFTKDADGTT